MGTTSTYFGGSGGGSTLQGNVSTIGSFFPLDYQLPLYMPYPAKNSSGIQQYYFAGNPLGNNYCARFTSTTGFQLRDNTFTTITSLAPTDINPSCARFGGACYKSNGNIVLIGSDAAQTPTFYYGEFTYDTATKPVGGDDGSFVSGVAYTAFDGTNGASYNMLFDGTNYRIQGSQGWWGRTSNFSSSVFEGYGGASDATIIAANGIAVTQYGENTSTAGVQKQFIYRPDRSSEIASQTGTAFYAPINIHRNIYAYSPALVRQSSSSSLTNYIGYPDGRVWGAYRGVDFKLQEYDALMAEFQTKYVDVWEA
jgi:hypothetical protein